MWQTYGYDKATQLLLRPVIENRRSYQSAKMVCLLVSILEPKIKHPPQFTVKANEYPLYHKHEMGEKKRAPFIFMQD